MSYVVGASVWVPDDSTCYALSKVSAVAGGTVTAGSKTLPLADVAPFDSSDERQRDLVQMVNVDTANILNTLAKRHGEKAVYTSVGQCGIVISVNPYQWIDIYGTAVMREHYEAFGTRDLAPHVFSLAADAYKALCVHGRSQTIVTSGESGAGKTENAKQVFRFLAEIAGVQSAATDGCVSMQELLIHSNPVLEAFGNAKTLRNDNSSRFGKLVTVGFDGSGRIIGATTRNYLLEKPRVSAPPASERNYHAFYQLLAGLSPQAREARGLKTPAAHALLSASSCQAVAGMDDAAEWRATTEAMGRLGFTTEEVEAITDIAAALLVLGDVAIVTDAATQGGHGDDCATLKGGAKSVGGVATLLGVDADAFAAALTSLKVRETTNRLTVGASLKNRSALIGSTYSRLFDRIVERINGAAGEQRAALDDSRFIGVLDIFGFEIFEVNSFEQLCINFANEKLQRNFTMTTFSQEEGMYTSEGIQFTHIEYIDNAAVLELIDAAPKPGKPMRGLIHILDEEAHLPKTTDGTLLAKFNAAFGAAPGKKGSGHAAYATDFRRPTLFTIAHYAGAVTYTADHFLEKSVENVALGLVSALNGSSKPLVASLFTTMSSRRSVVASGGGGGGGSRKATVGLKFSKQLAKLIATIEATQPHFIRCIKPNSNKSASEFNTQLTLEQLRYSGVFEAAKIRKSGYPFRLSHRQFAHRYACVLTPAVSARLDFSEGAMRATVQTMLQAHLPTASELLKASAALSAAAGAPAPLAVDLSEVRVGKTRTFFRARENRTLELAREAAILPRLGLLRRIGRGIIARGARRRLAAARDELAAAIDAKELVRLEAAYAAALAPQRAFYRGAPLDFPLYVPHAAEIAALIANLREEARVEPSLAELVAAPELTGATYDQLRAELAVALRLREALGRAVPSLGAAECVVGMTDGVNEHDHERLSAALAAAEKLGLASRLAKPIERARAEIARLEGGKVLEQALRAELGSHGSVYNGKGAWDHAGMSTAGLQAALDAGLAHPLESKQGVALIAEARLTLVLRPLLVAEDWAGLMCYVDGLPPAASARELTNAKAELSDQAEARAQAMRAALATGSSVRTGECKWDHSGISTAAVLDARAAIESFPRRSDAAADLLDQASAVVVVRSALLSATWADVTSWGGLASALEGVPPSQRECEEVQAAWTEFGEMRGSLEAAVQRALDGGRSTKRTGGALGWSHDEIAIEPLVVACDQLEAFARQSDAGKALSGRGRRAVRVRRALLDAKWPAPTAVRSHTAASWEALSTELEALGAAPTTTTAAAAAREHDEVGAAHAELEEARAHYEGLVKEELGKGRSVKSGEAWDHGALSVDALQEALLEASDFPRPSANTTEVISVGQLIVEMRSCLLSAEWAEPSSWGGIVDFLDALDAGMRELEECIAAKLEVSDRRKAGETVLAQCLASGKSVRVSASEWSHDALASQPLADALAAVGAFPRQSDEGLALAARASVVLPIRIALQQVQPAAVATWGALWAALEGVPSELRSEPEVAAAWEEVLEARAATEAALKAALAKGRAVRCAAGGATALKAPAEADVSMASPTADSLLGLRRRTLSRVYSTSALKVSAALEVGGDGSHTWSHAELSTTEVVAALAQLRAFPKVSDAGVALGKLADAILELRAVLAKAPWTAELATDGTARAGWAELATWLEAAAGGAFAREEEVANACQAFADKRVSVEAMARATLDRERSEAPPPAQPNAAWSHASLSVAGLQSGLAELAAFPRTSEVGKALEALLRLMITLREALLAADWESAASWAPLADALDSGVAQSLATAEPVMQIRAEFEAKCAATEAAVQACLDTGRAVPLAGGGWSHEPIAVVPLVGARKELDAFPRPSEAGRRLAALAGIAIEVREALLAASFTDAASWAKLANVIDACSMRPEASELGELASAVEELEAARSGFEGAVSAVLRRGRVARRAPVASVAVNAAELATRWSHEPISAAELLSAAAEHDAFPRPSAAGRALVSRARVAAALREATLSCDITRAASWSLLCSALDQAARQLPPDELALIEDYTDARDELADARTFTELNVTSALASHRSLKVGGEWSHADLSAKELVAAVAELEAYPRVSDDGRDLATKAKQVIAIRLALSKCDWASASTWGGIAAALDAVPPELATLDEISAARTELLEKRDSVVAAVRAELLRGASLRSAGAGGGWDHTGISTAALDAAAAEAAAFPRPAPEAARLLEEARAISSLRAALKDAKFGAALSWQPLAAFLAGHAALDELDEVRAAWQELREARDATTAVLTSAIANGCSRSVGAAKAWDHSALDAKSLHAAAVELDTFPRLTGAGDAKPAMIRRQSMIQRRQSLERVTEAADHLVASTKSVCRVRELLLGSSWAELHSLLTTLEAGPPLHELCAEEVRRASLELQDQLAMLEAAVRTSLDAHRSKRPTGGGAWDHSELSVDALQEAMVALRGFPLHGASTASLLKVGEFVVRVRKLLAASAWGELCSVLATTADSELMQNDEVRAAGIEVEEMRQQVVAHLSGAIELGRSLKIVGKKVNVFVDKSYFLPITWDHSGIADGIVKLRAAVGSVGAFPGVAEREGVGPMLELASLLLKLRQMIDKEDWAALGAALDAIVLPSHLTHDEVKMARQEYLTNELERATKKLDQRALKLGLAMATSAGMLPVEKPVYQALGVFIDPPEFIINLPKPMGSVPIEVGPDAGGQLELTVKVRGATSVQWMKNGIALKEGADGGRVLGVATPTLTFTRMLGRDENQKLQCVAKNKFGIIKSNEVAIRLKGASVAAAMAAEAEPAAEKDEGDGSDDDEDDDIPKRRVSLVVPMHVTATI